MHSAKIVFCYKRVLYFWEMKIKDITKYLEGIAPISLQENYDNCGLIIGDYESNINSALITLDCTESVIDEAIEQNCNLVISHHPLIFSPVKKINGSNYIERTIIKAIKNDIAVYALHTNLDNVKNGVNGKIAEMLELKNTSVLSLKEDQLRQLVFYCPKKYVNNIKNALFNPY